MEHARLISIVIHKFVKDRQLTFAARYSGARSITLRPGQSAVYSRARTKQGRGVIKEIYILLLLHLI